VSFQPKGRAKSSAFGTCGAAREAATKTLARACASPVVAFMPIPQVVVDLLEHAIDHSSWPIAACIIAWILRHQITGALGRLRKVTAGPVSAELEGQQASGPAPLAGVQERITAATTDSKSPVVTDAQKKFVAETIISIATGAPIPSPPPGTGPVDETAVQNARLSFEASAYKVWSVIFPQQLRALKLLKLNDLTYDQLTALYNETVRTSHVRNFGFDAWLGYLKNNYLIVESAGGDGKTHVRLSVLGHAFIDFCMQRGLDRLKGV